VNLPSSACRRCEMTPSHVRPMTPIRSRRFQFRGHAHGSARRAASSLGSVVIAVRGGGVDGTDGDGWARTETLRVKVRIVAREARRHLAAAAEGRKSATLGVRAPRLKRPMTAGQ